MIEKLKLAGYFLIVWDIVNYCREEGILVQGRGSAANSERGNGRISTSDLPSGDKREKVIQHVYQRYGELGSAMTANVITYRGRSAAREVGKVMGFEVGTLERLSSLVPVWGWKDADNSAEKQFQDAGMDLEHPRVRKFFELVTGIQDMPRHLGQHSGGMVVCQGQLNSVVPLEPASMPGRVVVQWDKEDCADLGLVKIDLLGLGMMSALEDTLALISEHEKKDIDLGQLPANDLPVYEMLQKGGYDRAVSSGEPGATG